MRQRIKKKRRQWREKIKQVEIFRYERSSFMRNITMFNARKKEGKTYRVIAEEFFLTTERVRQILYKFNNNIKSQRFNPLMHPLSNQCIYAICILQKFEDCGKGMEL